LTPRASSASRAAGIALRGTRVAVEVFAAWEVGTVVKADGLAGGTAVGAIGTVETEVGAGGSDFVCLISLCPNVHANIMNVNTNKIYFFIFFFSFKKESN